jgi:hypothetical protein
MAQTPKTPMTNPSTPIGISQRSRISAKLKNAMPDLLVNLLKLPPFELLLSQLKAARVNIRRAQPFEISSVRRFVESNFSVAWADELSVLIPESEPGIYVDLLK